MGSETATATLQRHHERAPAVSGQGPDRHGEERSDDEEDEE
jgi:hypothetical protein